MSPPGRPRGESPSAQREGSPASARAGLLALLLAMPVLAGCERSAGPAAVSAAEIELVLGNGGGNGNLDGRGDAARFDFPKQIVRLDADSMLVVDGSSGRVRRVTRSGDVSTVWVGDAAAIAARPDGTLLAVSLSDGVVRRIASDGRVTTLAGRERESGLLDGVGDAARFKWSWGTATDRAGRVYVFDDDGRVVRRVDDDGRVTTVPMPVLQRGDARRLVALAPATDDGWWAVSDWDRRVLRLGPDGAVRIVVGTGAEGYTDGPADTAVFANPGAITTWGDAVVVADVDNGALRRIERDGRVSTLYRSRCVAFAACERVDGASAEPPLRSPRGIAWLDADTLAVADSYNNAVYLVDRAGRMQRLAGLPAQLPATVDSELSGCIRLAAGADGAIYCQSVNTFNWWRIEGAGRVQRTVSFAEYKRALDKQQERVTRAAERDPKRNPEFEPAAPEPPTQLDALAAVAVGRHAIYAAQDRKHTLVALDPTGRSLPRIVAGREGNPGAQNGPASRARFRSPRGVAVDAAGVVYLADTGNHAIRRIAPDGTVTTYAGRLGTAGAVDGDAKEARFREPKELRIGPDGALYVLDAGNTAIRRIDGAQRVTTLGGADVAGCTTPCAAGCGPRYETLAVDPAGRVWTTTGGREIHLMPPDQPPRRVLGSPTRRGFRPDIAAESLPFVTAIAFDGRGSLFIGNGEMLLRVNAAALERRVAAVTKAAELYREPGRSRQSSDSPLADSAIAVSGELIGQAGGCRK